MTKRERKTLEAYTRSVADSMCLQDWTIHLDWENPAGDGDGASIAWPEGRKNAAIRLSAEFTDYDAEEQRYVIVHELVHCHLASMQDTVEEDLQVHLGRPTYDIYSRSFRRALEYGVDALASALASYMPLIDWEK